MYLDSAVIGPEGGHAAGRALLKKMYEAAYGAPMPPVCIAERGKPYFENSAVHFSISHTKKRVFCAIGPHPIGIDAEEMDRDIDLHLADKILSANELAQYHAASDRRLALLTFWVLKEAQAKYTGEGLRGYPNRTDFSLNDPCVRQLDGCLVAIVTVQ